MGRFDFNGGALCLDFTNTAVWHASSEPKELLQSYSDLVSWGQEAGILTSERAAYLSQVNRLNTEDGAGAYERAVRLREATYRIFSAITGEEDVSPEDVAVLNESLADAMGHMMIAKGPDGFTWDWYGSAENLDQIIWPAARSAAELLTADEIERLKECADDRGCGYLFLDTSRNRSRRWCSMESCGNRAKARRHYHREKEKIAE